MDGDLGLLYFGRDDAEMDIAEGGLLHAGFLRTAAYDTARTSRKHLIIGRRGSGKSAICRTLVTDTDPSLVTALVTPDELSADEIRRFELQGIPPEMAKGLMWRYILTTQVAKHLVTESTIRRRLGHCTGSWSPTASWTSRSPSSGGSSRS
jgi:GTPase SAR1 family protein